MTYKIIYFRSDRASHRIDDPRAKAGSFGRRIGATSYSIIFYH
jgi:hypothetical protein